MNKFYRFCVMFWFFWILRINKYIVYSCFYGRNLCFEICMIKFLEIFGRVKVFICRYIGYYFVVCYVLFFSVLFYVFYMMSIIEWVLYIKVFEF